MVKLPCETCLVLPICKQKVHDIMTSLSLIYAPKTLMQFITVERILMINFVPQCSILGSYTYEKKVSIPEHKKKVSTFFKIHSIWLKLYGIEKGN